MSGKLKTQFLVGLIACAFYSAANAQQLTSVDSLQTEEYRFISKSIGITDFESVSFLPVYTQYLNELNQLKQNNVVFVLMAYKDQQVCDDEAWLGLDEFVRFEQEKAHLKKKYANKFRKAIPPKKAAMYFMLESKMDANSNYDLAEMASLNALGAK